MSSNLPSTQSPIAYILSTLVLSLSAAMIFPLFAVFTPTVYRPKLLVSAPLPVANMTISNIS